MLPRILCTSLLLVALSFAESLTLALPDALNKQVEQATEQTMALDYKVRDVLPGIPQSDYSSYNGIMFAKKIGDGAWEINLLNDGSKVNKNFVKTKYLPSLILLRGR